jgi:hypothetical protein
MASSLVVFAVNAGAVKIQLQQTKIAATLPLHKVLVVAIAIQFLTLLVWVVSVVTLHKCTQSLNNVNISNGKNNKNQL